MCTTHEQPLNRDDLSCPPALVATSRLNSSHARNPPHTLPPCAQLTRVPTSTVSPHLPYPAAVSYTCHSRALFTTFISSLSHSLLTSNYLANPPSSLSSPASLLQVAPDFFDYFSATAPLLYKVPTPPPLPRRCPSRDPCCHLICLRMRRYFASPLSMTTDRYKLLHTSLAGVILTTLVCGLCRGDTQEIPERSIVPTSSQVAAATMCSYLRLAGRPQTDTAPMMNTATSRCIPSSFVSSGKSQEHSMCAFLSLVVPSACVAHRAGLADVEAAVDAARAHMA